MNLSGIIFHIEEDAYDKLNKYLSTIKRYFSTTEGRDEIMGDIESRIAEMLQEKVSNAKQAVLLADVESIIAVMGKPEDFAAENEQQESKQQSAQSEYTYKRRLFRDPDDRILGGVCSGIANYFDIDPIWIRGIFAIAFFVFGSGFLLYAILWMIMPLAKTTAEKLQMRGEKVDINNIGKAVNEEFTYVKKRMDRFGEEISSPANKERFRETTRSAGHFLGAALTSALKLAAKIFAIIALIISIILLTGLMAAIFGKGNFMVFDADSTIRFSIYEFAASVLPLGISSEMVLTTMILFFGIPLSFIIYSVVKFLFGIKERNKIVNYAASILWLTGIALMVYIGIQVGTDFSTEAFVKKNVNIIQPENKKLYLDINSSDANTFYIHHRGSRIRLDNWTLISKEGNHYRLGYPRMDIVASETDSFQLVIIKSANGPDKKEASILAKNISYETIQKDSLLLFNGYFDIGEDDKFRAQQVKIVLKVPINKSIYLSRRMEKIIFDIDNVTNTLDRDMVNRSWIMTPQGLECLDCTGMEATVDGRDMIKSVHVSVNGDIDIDKTNGKKHKHIIIRKGDNSDFDTEDITNESGKKVIIRKKVLEGDKNKGDLKKIEIQVEEKKN
jgi:phage shock protein PspC (stress-responsive transcriptional regulator)